MKKIFLIAAMAVATNASAGWGDDQETPPAEPIDPETDPVAIKYREDTAKFDQVIWNFRNLEVYAGAYNEINFRGVTWIVDRSLEPRRINPSPGTIAAGAAATGALVKDLKGGAKGNVQVRITYREYDKITGKVTSEAVFEVSTAGSFEIDTGGFQESTQKQHK